MTVIVSVKINDGIVMAADSVTSFAIGQCYQHANKIVNLRKGLPIGAMITGNGGIGSESIETLFKDLRRRFAGEDKNHKDWALDPENYVLADVAARLRKFLFEEKCQKGTIEARIRVRICGYSANRPLSEVWDVHLWDKECPEPMCIQAESNFGPAWEGECEALNRLILGLGGKFITAAEKIGLTKEAALKAANELLIPELTEPLVMPAMPIQDAIDLARFMVETTSMFIKFSVDRSKTVGGPVEIAAITKHEGFKWIQRKLFYPSALN